MSARKLSALHRAPNLVDDLVPPPPRRLEELLFDPSKGPAVRRLRVMHNQEIQQVLVDHDLDSESHSLKSSVSDEQDEDDIDLDVD